MSAWDGVYVPLSFPLVSSIKFALHLDAVVADVGAARFDDVPRGIAELVLVLSRQNLADVANANAVSVFGEIHSLEARVVADCPLA